MKIYNGTPHTIRLFKESQCYSDTDSRKLIVKEGEVPILEVESNGVLNAVKENAPLPEQFEESDIPLKGAVTFTNCDDLPGGYDLYVASNLYRAARIELGLSTDHIATICDAVYSNTEDPRPVGCLSLAVG